MGRGKYLTECIGGIFGGGFSSENIVIYLFDG